MTGGHLDALGCHCLLLLNVVVVVVTLMTRIDVASLMRHAQLLVLRVVVLLVAATVEWATLLTASDLGISLS